MIRYFQCEYFVFDYSQRKWILKITGTNTQFLLLQIKKKKYQQKMLNLNNIKYLIKRINGQKEIDYGKDLTKTKIDTDDELPLDKLGNLPSRTVIIRSAFEDGKSYVQMFYKNSTNLENQLI